MNIRRVETMHYTPEQVNDHIAQAIVLLDEQELTAGEREQLLPHVVNLLAAKSITVEQLQAIPDLSRGDARH